MRRIGLAVVVAFSCTLSSPATEAQTMRTIPTIGVFNPSVARTPNVDAFEQSLRELGWVNGQNVRIEARAPVGPEGVAPPLADLLSLSPRVIVVWGTVGALAVKQSTSRIPVVFLATGDPVSLGLVTSLAHPGANLTGVPAIASSEEFAKRLALLKEAVPSAVRIALLVGPDGRRLLDLNRERLMAAASSLKLEIHEVLVQTPGEVELAIRTAKRHGTQALYVWPSGFTLTSGKQLADVALRVGLPSVHPFSENALAGGLFSYSASLTEIARRGGVYVDKILKGTRPADLPVEQPTRFELVINLKTAKAPGLAIPQSLLVRADELIQ